MSPYDEYVYWISKAPVHMSLSDAEIEKRFWQCHPRWHFIKGLGPDAKMLDIGAGKGLLSYWRDGRTMWGVDFRVGEHSAKYAGWAAINLDIEKPNFPGVLFDAFYASHLIEHLVSIEDLVRYFDDVATDNAKVYFEWPAPKTALFPTRGQFYAATGHKVSTLNFFDDGSHKQIVEPEMATEILGRYGFKVLKGGEIDTGQIAVEHMARAREKGGDMQAPLWCATGWAYHIVAQRG
jgi:hypothetical protein